MKRSGRRELLPLLGVLAVQPDGPSSPWSPCEETGAVVCICNFRADRRTDGALQEAQGSASLKSTVQQQKQRDVLSQPGAREELTFESSPLTSTRAVAPTHTPCPPNSDNNSSILKDVRERKI